MRFSSFAEVEGAYEISETEELAALDPHHMWTPEYAESRFKWRPKKPLTVLVLRTYLLQETVELPYRDEYGGCKSWIELGEPVSVDGARSRALGRGLRRAGRARARGAGASRARAGRRLRRAMGSGAITIVLIFLLLFVSWQTIYAANRDLARAKAWGALVRRSLPFFALLLMVLSLFVVQSFGESWTLVVWMATAGVAVIGASLLSVSPLERRANKAFRSGDYARAVELYRELVDEKPLARNKAFLGAALGAGERYEESVDLSTQAIEEDPQYGLAYYNRALVLQRMGKKSRAIKDLEKAQETDLPRRFRSASRRMLEEIS